MTLPKKTRERYGRIKGATAADWLAYQEDSKRAIERMEARDRLRSQARNETIKRNKAIIAMRKRGMTLKDIGEVYGISDERVRQICL